MVCQEILAGYVPMRYSTAMKTYTEEDFREWGRKGGQNRARLLSPARKRAIAKKAGSAKRKLKAARK